MYRIAALRSDDRNAFHRSNLKIDHSARRDQPGLDYLAEADHVTPYLSTYLNYDAPTYAGWR